MRSTIVLATLLLVALGVARAEPGDGKPYGAPDPASCPATSGAKLPPPDVLARLVQCNDEGGTGHYYHLLREIHVEVGSGRTGAAGDGLACFSKAPH